jgi:multiple sugar transport system permease protein
VKNTPGKNTSFPASVVLCTAGLLFLLPLIFTFTNSFMEESEILMNYSSRLTVFDLVEGLAEKFIRITLIPRKVTIGQYAEVLVNRPSFLVLLFNSLAITLPVTLGSLVFSFTTAYGFTFCRWKYREVLFAAYIATLLLPLQAVLVPNYIIADLLGIKDSILAIILPGIFSPFGVFLMRQNLKSLPPSYVEAAEMDGAGHRHVLWFIVLPQMRSSAAALAMLTFIEYWNLVEQAVIFITDYTREPLSVYLSRLSGAHTALVFAASCVYMLPPLWFLFSGRELMERGIELSGIK